jgi:deoxyribose-phosphate aldolase
MPESGPLDLGKHIDHSCLRPDATLADIIKLCDEAIEFQFRAVAVGPAFVHEAARHLDKHAIPVVSPVGYPLGFHHTDVKVYECKKAVDDGAREIEVVPSLGALRGHSYASIERELELIVRAAAGAVVRVTVEGSLLTSEELVLICKLAKGAGAAGVVLSTGFASTPIGYEPIRRIKGTMGLNFVVKACGGIRTQAEVFGLLQAGAGILATSAGPKIVRSMPEYLDVLLK